MRRTASAALAAALLSTLLPPPPAGAAPVAAPPMGWNSRALGCSVSETSVRRAADALAPLAPLGYRYVIIDGCWQAQQRSGDALAPDPARFPGGIAALAAYVRGKGLKLGLSLSAGTRACSGGGPGSYGSEAADARQVREWGVEYVKYDWCSVPTADFPGQNVQQIAQALYPRMRQALGDSVAFAMNNEDGNTVPWLWGRDAGATTWRTNVHNRPIAGDYPNMVSLWETNQLRAEYAGPGSWADPDLIQAGLGGMTEAEQRTQFTLWAIGAAPLILQADPAKAPAAVIADPDVIAVNQDKLGVQGRLTRSDGWYHVITKPLENGDQAVALFNESDRAATISATLGPGHHRVEDLWTGAVATTRGALAAYVPAHGAVLYRVGERRDPAPPLVTLEVDPPSRLGEDRPSVLEPGRPGEIVTRLVNTGATGRLRDLEVTLGAPAGWRVTPRTPATARTLDGGEAFTVTWAVTPPAEGTGTHELVAEATSRDVRSTGSAVVTLARAPAPGRTHLSDLTWTAARNHFGPVEKDTSNGDRAAGDGRPLTIGGVTYAKGLGAHAPAEIEYYTGGRCTTLRFLAGIDDEVEAAGSARFEVWADGGRVAASGLLTGADPAAEITASVEGAHHVRLVATNGGDNAYSDHVDFADATITCR